MTAFEYLDVAFLSMAAFGAGTILALCFIKLKFLQP